jgi:hypothetical protein
VCPIATRARFLQVDDRDKVVVETLRAEAIALFQVNQAARTAAERVAALTFAVVAITVAAGINAETDDVAIVLPSVVLLLLSYMFQQYADVAVIGAARASLEARVNAVLVDRCLIYETEVASIHKGRPLVGSFHFLRALLAALVLALLCVGTYVAFDGQEPYVEVAYQAATLASLVSAVWSFIAMLRGFGVATRKLERLGGAAAHQGTKPPSLRW